MSKDRDRPPPNWACHQSQNLHRPWTCEETGMCTLNHETEAAAIANAWDIYDRADSIRTQLAEAEARAEKAEAEREGADDAFAIEHRVARECQDEVAALTAIIARVEKWVEARALNAQDDGEWADIRALRAALHPPETT